MDGSPKHLSNKCNNCRNDLGLAGHARPAEGIVRQHFLPEGVGMYRLGVSPLLKGYKGTGGLYIITVSLF